MKSVRKIGGIVLFWIVGLIKFPFTLVIGLFTVIEYLLTAVMTKVAELSKSAFLIDGTNYWMERNSEGCEFFAEEYEELKIES